MRLRCCMVLVSAVLFGCGSDAIVIAAGGGGGSTLDSTPVADVMAEALHVVEVTLGARRDHAALRLELDVPASYHLTRGGPDDGNSTHSFECGEGLTPSLSVRRPVGSSEELGRSFGDSGEEVTRGVRGATRWAVEVSQSAHFRRTIVDTITTMPDGTDVFCGGYVDTVDETPVGDWIVERCASLRVVPGPTT